MGVYGPYTAVAGTVQQCAVDPDAQAVYIRNSSIYDLYIAASPIAPAATSAFGGWPWVARIPQGDRAGIVLPLERYAGAGFPGYIWVLPQVATAGFAISGTSSNNSTFTLEGYDDASEMPPGYASPQYQNISSQPRVVTLPVGMLQWAQGQWTIAAASNPILNFALNLAPGQTQTLYLYYALFSLATTTTTQVADLDLEAQYLHGGSGGTLLGSAFVLARFVIGSPQGGAAPLVEINPRNPIAFQSTIPATADTLRVSIHEQSGATGFGVDFLVAASPDLANQTAIGPIGNNQTQTSPTLY